MESLGHREVCHALTGGSFVAWYKTVQRGPDLMTPARFLYRDYQQFCQEECFPTLEAKEFMSLLSHMSGIKFKEAGTGRIRRMVLGAAPGSWRT